MTYVKFNNRPFERTVNNLVDDIFDGLPQLFSQNSGLVPTNGFVPVNIKETGNGYSLEIIAPGFNKADFNIKLDANILTISAEKKSETEKTQNEKQIRREYSYRNFKRSFTIDEKTDATGIEASYVNGVMTLNLPKRKEVTEEVKEILVK